MVPIRWVFSILKSKTSVLCLLALALIGFLSFIPAAGYTRLELSEPVSGRRIHSAVLRDGEEATLTWRNSLFGLDVTEVFRTRRGLLVLDGVTFALPGGPAPPDVKPADVDDLYHTGGPFSARGIDKSFQRITFQVSDVGHPKLKIRDRLVDFKNEVGFGGAIILTVAPATWFEALLALKDG